MNEKALLAISKSNARRFHNKPKKAPFVQEAWSVARQVAAIDKQLLSSQAVEAFAKLAETAAELTARRCVAIVTDAKKHYYDEPCQGVMHVGLDCIARRINDEFDLGEHS